MSTKVSYTKLVRLMAIIIVLVFKCVKCDDWEYRLVNDLLKNYDSSIRPSIQHNSTLNVTFGLALTQIIDVVGNLVLSKGPNTIKYITRITQIFLLLILIRFIKKLVLEV